MCITTKYDPHRLIKLSDAKRKVEPSDTLEPSKLETVLISQLKAAVSSLDSKQPETVIGKIVTSFTFRNTDACIVK